MESNAITNLRLLFSGIIFLLALLFASQSQAILIQALPSASDVTLGDAFRIDIVISGLEQQPQPEIVRAYHLDLAYAPNLVENTDIVFGDYLGLSNPLSTLFRKSEVTAGNVMLEELSIFSEPVLDAAQPDSFMLASIGFTATDLGTVNFDLLPYLNFGIDVKGRSARVLPLDHMGGVVNINAVAIPEPSTVLLLGIALLGFAKLPMRRVKQKK
jgi:hypothetical protein